MWYSVKKLKVNNLYVCPGTLLTIPHFLFTEPPSAPRGPVSVAKLSTDSAELRWTPPEYNGGTPITGYYIEVREASRTIWRRIASVEATCTSYTLRNMLEGNEYYVRIVARNTEGESLPLSSDIIVPAKTYSESISNVL